MGRIIVTIFFTILWLNAWVQVAIALAGGNSDPLGLRAWQFISGTAAGIAALGAFRLRRWAPLAALAYAVITAAMIASLGRMLDLDEADRGGLLAGAATVLVVCGGAALYLRRLVKNAT